MIVEDEALVAMDLEDTIEANGGEIFALVATVPAALESIENDRPDAVTLDLNLNGQSTVEVAQALRDHSIPFLVLTGYVQSALSEPALKGARLIEKPWRAVDLVNSLKDLMQHRSD